MKKTLNTPRVLSSMVAVALLGIFVGSPAWGQDAKDDLFNSYTIASGNSSTGTEDDVHEKAIYIVFQTTGSPELAGLFFMERKKNSAYKDQPFICNDAVWSESNDSYSCSRFVFHNKKVKKEVLTVGILSGPFCDNLRSTYNKHSKKIILDSTDPGCKGEEQCSCYGVKHLCKEGDAYTDCQKSFAPSSGAGSGKNN